MKENEAAFRKEAKRFIFPSAIEQAFLSFKDSSVLSQIRAVEDQKAEAEQLQKEIAALKMKLQKTGQ